MTEIKFKTNLPARIQEILNQIISISKTIDTIEQIILYGSWAKQTAMERSDIDLAVFGEFIDWEPLVKSIEKIPTLYKIDLLQVSTCKNQLLLDEVEKYGIEVYRKI